jgi:RNA polymerase-binding protein DksA
MKIDVMRQRLLRQRRQLLWRYHEELDRAEELSAPEIEDVDRAAEQWDARVLAQLGKTDAAALERVTSALRRIDEGRYGMCTTCHSPIPEARLVAIPSAELCIGCADEMRPTRPVRVVRPG